MAHGARSTGRRRNADEIRSILSWQRRSGLSLLAFARKQGICYATLRRGCAVYGGAGAADFVEVELDPGARPGDFVLDWAPGRSLRIPTGFDPGRLRCLLEVLGVLP